MSRMSDLPMRLTRGLLGATVLAVFSLGVAGRTALPMLNAFLAVCAGALLVGMLVIDADLARERWRRGQTGEDPVRLVWIRVVFLALFVFALLDIGLPKKGGWDVILRMKEENPQFKVVVSSGYIDPESKTKMLQVGVKDFIEKPYTPDAVVETIESALEITEQGYLDVR